MKAYKGVASRPVEQVSRLFNEIEDILDINGPIAMLPESLLKARIDVLATLIWFEQEMVEINRSRDGVMPMTFHATE